jgi:hypothetical protein
MVAKTAIIKSENLTFLRGEKSCIFIINFPTQFENLKKIYE